LVLRKFQIKPSSIYMNNCFSNLNQEIKKKTIF